MKLALFIYSLSGGGAERQASYILSYCVKKNIDVHLILMNDIIKYDLPENLQIHYLEKSNSSENGLLKFIKIPYLAYKYAKLVNKLGVTHSVSMLTRPNFINILSKKFTKHKFKIIINELAYPSLQYSYKDFQSNLNKKLISWLYKKSDTVIGNSDGNIKDLIDNFKVPSDKTIVVKNPIDLKKIDNIEPVIDFYNDDYFNIITLGRLQFGKNHKMLIEAISILNLTNVRLYIFGIGNMQSELENYIKDLKLEKQLFLMGFDPNPYKYLKSADLFIFGSNHEGFPNVVLEAMACELPILTTNCKSGPGEIMKLQQEQNDIMITDYGILVPIKNAELMAKGIAYFLNNEEYIQTCKKNGLVRIKDFEKYYILDKYISALNII